MNKANLIRLLLTVSFLVMLAFPLSAQEKADSVLMFRFLSGRDMFFSPGMNNGAELARLFDCVDRYKDRILGHEIMLHVDGYCSSKGSEAGNRAIARIRSNRVKSELITRKGLKEDCFVTRNHVENGDFVTVRIFISKADLRPEPQEPDNGPQALRPEEPLPATVSKDADDNAAAVAPAEADDLSAQQPAVEGTPANRSAVKSDSKFVLKTNLLGYAALMPNVEAEWKFADRWSAALEVQGAWYARNSSPRRVYRLATVTPELRYWAIDHSRWHGMYVGLFGGAGLYDLSNSRKGHEGEGAMAGVSVGYMWPIGKRLSLDAGLGVGYLYARDKVYAPLDGHYLYQFTKDINYVGPLRLKLSLVWRFQREKTDR